MNIKSGSQKLILIVFICLTMIFHCDVSFGLNNVDGSLINNLAHDNSEHKSHHGNFYFGISFGFPFVFGLRGEECINRSKDFRPDILATIDLGATAGCYASVGLEKRLFDTPTYLGAGYNFTRFYFAGGAGYKEYSSRVGIHSLMISFAIRTSYQKSASVCFSLDGLVHPWYSDLDIIPLLRIRIIRAD